MVKQIKLLFLSILITSCGPSSSVDVTPSIILAGKTFSIDSGTRFLLNESDISNKILEFDIIFDNSANGTGTVSIKTTETDDVGSIISIELEGIETEDLDNWDNVLTNWIYDETAKTLSFEIESLNPEIGLGTIVVNGLEEQ